MKLNSNTKNFLRYSNFFVQTIRKMRKREELRQETALWHAIRWYDADEEHFFLCLLDTFSDSRSTGVFPYESIHRDVQVVWSIKISFVVFHVSRVFALKSKRDGIENSGYYRISTVRLFWLHVPINNRQNHASKLLN